MQIIPEPVVGDLCVVNSERYVYLGDVEPDVISGPRIVRSSFNMGSHLTVDVRWQGVKQTLSMTYFPTGIGHSINRRCLRFIQLLGSNGPVLHVLLNDCEGKHMNAIGNVPSVIDTT